MKNGLLLAAFSETATGLALLIVPSLVGRLLLGEELAGAAIPIARVLGTALIALGIACWPGRTARSGMLVYSTAVALYLGGIGCAGGPGGVLLWPAVVAHLLLTALLARGISPEAPPSSKPSVISATASRPSRWRSCSRPAR